MKKQFEKIGLNLLFDASSSSILRHLITELLDRHVVEILMYEWYAPY